GWPRQMGQTLVLGGFPNFCGQPQKSFVRVASWTWTSRPMTASHAVLEARAGGGASGAGAPPEVSGTSGGLGLPDRVAGGEPDREAVDRDEGREAEAAPRSFPQVPEREERARAPQE